MGLDVYLKRRVAELEEKNADLEARLGHEQVVTMQNREAQLQGYIRDLGARVAALQEIVEPLRDERCKVIMLIEKLKSVANDPDWEYKGLEHDYDWYAQEARRQLAKEHPEVFG